MKDHKYSRRKFLGRSLTGSLLFGTGIIFGCSSMKSVAQEVQSTVPSEDPNAAKDTLETSGQQKPVQNTTVQQKNPCDDLSGISEEEIAKRKKLAYVNKTPIPDSHCSNCALYLPPGKDKPCGGCMLFKGPVRAEGYCAYWAPINN